MMKKSLSILCFLFLFVGFATAQTIPFNPEHSLGIDYQSKTNPYYWKNRPPFAGYWQQDVHYKIKAKLNVKTRAITGKQTLIYTNNSPDTLQFVYFHLYQNAFQPGSYNDQLHRSRGDYSLSKLGKSSRGGSDINKITDGGNNPLKIEMDNTIMKVLLNEPLLPGASAVFHIDFKTYFGFIRRRMKYNPSHGVDQFTGTHWYPRISVYDMKFGWTTDQHLGHEFYGDFGTYEVDLTLPNDFVVAATGYLLNRKEVLPDSLMKKLDVHNFKDKPMGEKPSVIIKRDPQRPKTWRYKAVNVHDFAWTADPSYRIGEAEWNGIKCYAFAREWKAAKWQDAAQFAADVIRTYSSDIGLFGYHKMIVADADDGMEYPMITMDGGTSPGYYGLFAHEIGHNWFFGMVGNNETYRALLDEGFTQFLTAWSMEKLVHRQGKPGKENFKYENNSNERWGNYYSYFSNVKNNSDAPLTTHSDLFNLTRGGANLYGEVYYKTVVMLYALQYVLGDRLFQNAIRHYFAKWKFCHPYEDDFRQAVIEYTGWDLNWFFDEWLNKTYEMDYALDKFKAKKTTGGWQAKVKLHRKGRAIMPLDLVFKLSDGSTKLAVVPVADRVKKEGDPIVLPKWYGWGDFNADYEASVPLPAKPVSVEIDPSGRLADCYQLDNYSGFPRLEFLPDWKRSDYPFDKYQIKWMPKLWFNDVDGLRLGLNFDGSTMNFNGFGNHQVRFSPELGVNFPAHPLSYTFLWREPLGGLPRPIFFTMTSRMQDGYGRHGFSLSYDMSETPGRGSMNNLTIGIYFSRLFDKNYLWIPSLWRDRPLNTLRLNYLRQYRYGRNVSNLSVNLTTALAGTPAPFSKLVLQTVHKFSFSRLHFRLRGVLGYATAGVPPQAAFYINMASPEDWITDSRFAARGTLPVSWGHGGHLHPAGGGNLRGYNPRLFDLAAHSFTHRDNRLAAVNLEIGLWNPVSSMLQNIPFIGDLLHFDLYGFSDLGSTNFTAVDEMLALGESALDAGVGVLWQPYLPWRYNRILGYPSLRIDFPIFVSDPGGKEKQVEFRWMIGFGRAF